MFSPTLKHRALLFLSIFLSITWGAGIAWAQTTEFTYQGRLLDGALPANAGYDFEFRLFALETGGTELGIQSRPGVSITSGIFTVRLDFGANFDGTARWLEIGVRPAGSPNPFTTLIPRQPLSSAPYAIRSLNSAAADTAAVAGNSSQLGGIPANQFVVTTDSRMTDARNPLPFNQNYIQNTINPQAASNFYISGTGRADVFNAETQFNIQGARVLSVPGNNNTFAGWFAGTSNTTGAFNTFIGNSAGNQTTTGAGNTFVGFRSGRANTAGGSNSFFGAGAGVSSVSGAENSFFGNSAGGSNTMGGGNAFFGQSTGFANITGSDNTFLGTFTGSSNTTGFRNTLIGHSANVGSPNLTNATAIGFNAVVNTSNTMVLGTNIVNVQVPGDLAVAGTFNAAAANVSNLAVSGTLSASGVSLTNLNADNITTGTLSNARLGIVPIANGGTGSATRTFVNLTSNEFIGGNKSFTNTINTSAQYNILGQRVLGASADQNNVFVGIDAGAANASTGSTFVGDSAGLLNSSGQDNSFFGRDAGNANTTGHRNAFFGVNAGGSNIDGLNNAFFGHNAGNSNTVGSSNTIIGYNADVGANNLTNATAIGSDAVVNTSNTMVLGTNAVTVDIPGTFNVGGGGQIARMRSVTDDINFLPVSNAQSVIVSVPGAQINDVVLLGLPTTPFVCCLVYTAWVSSTGFVTVRVDNTNFQSMGAIDPPDATYRILVIGF